MATIRLTLDVNVWINHYLSLARGRIDSSAQRLVRAAFAGRCRLGSVQPVLSHNMLDTLQEVLARLAFPESLAQAARDAVEASAIGGISGEAPHMVLGGGVQPVRDAEDLGVLDTAVAGFADLLVTNNLADFLPGSRADIDARQVHADRDGRADAILMDHPRSRHGLVVASVFVARAWLIDGPPPPAGVLERFRAGA